MTGALLLATLTAAYGLAPVLVWPVRWWRAARRAPNGRQVDRCLGIPCQRHPVDAATPLPVRDGVRGVGAAGGLPVDG